MATPVGLRTKTKKAPSKKPATNGPLTDDEREKIKQLHAAGKGRNAIATEIKRSGYTVSKAIKEMGLAFDESQTVEATASRVAKMRDRRVDLAEKLLNDVELIHQRLWSEHTYYERGTDSLIPVTLPLPPLRDLRDGYSALQIALKGHTELIAGSTDATVESKRSVLANLIAGIHDVVKADKAAGNSRPDMGAPVEGDIPMPADNAAAGEEKP